MKLRESWVPATPTPTTRRPAISSEPVLEWKWSSDPHVPAIGRRLLPALGGHSTRTVLRVAALPFEVAVALTVVRTMLEHLRLGVRLAGQALLELAAELAKWLDVLRGGPV